MRNSCLHFPCGTAVVAVASSAPTIPAPMRPPPGPFAWRTRRRKEKRARGDEEEEEEPAATMRRRRSGEEEGRGDVDFRLMTEWELGRGGPPSSSPFSPASFRARFHLHLLVARLKKAEAVPGEGGGEKEDGVRSRAERLTMSRLGPRVFVDEVAVVVIWSWEGGKKRSEKWGGISLEGGGSGGAGCTTQQHSFPTHDCFICCQLYFFGWKGRHCSNRASVSL